MNFYVTELHNAKKTVKIVHISSDAMWNVGEQFCGPKKKK